VFEQGLTVSGLAERVGLNWFSLLVGKLAFEDAPLPYPATLPEVRQRLGSLGKKKLDDALEYCNGLLEREEKRLDKVESKAFTLIGITGIAAGFITGFAGLFLDRDKITSLWALIPAAILYILVVISSMLTIFLAIKVVTVGDYRFTYPKATDIFDLSRVSLEAVRRERAASLFYSFAQNCRVVNRKATFLSGAQLWFRNSIILLLILTFFLAIPAFFMPTATSGVSTPTVGATTTVQPATKTSDTPQPAATPTIAVQPVTTVTDAPQPSLAPSNLVLTDTPTTSP